MYAARIAHQSPVVYCSVPCGRIILPLLRIIHLLERVHVLSHRVVQPVYYLPTNNSAIIIDKNQC